MKIAISGINGFVGSYLGLSLKNRGIDVTGVGRSKPDWLADDHFFTASLGTTIDPGFLAGTDRFIHNAYDLRPGKSNLNIEGTKLWSQNARDAGVPEQYFISSCVASPNAASEYGKSKGLLEQYFTASNDCVVRLGTVVGPGGFFRTLAKLVEKLPVVPVPGGDSLLLHLTNPESLVEFFASDRVFPKGQTFNMIYPERARFLTFLRLVNQQFKLRSSIVPVPYSLAYFGLKSLETIGINLKFSSSQLAGFRQKQTYNIASSLEELGITVRPVEQLLADFDQVFADYLALKQH